MSNSTIVPSTPAGTTYRLYGEHIATVAPGASHSIVWRGIWAAVTT